MRFEHSVVLGWTWFGIGRVRLLPTETTQYTIWLVFLTNKFAVGIHYNLPWRPKMQPYQQRVVTEKQELDEKRSKLDLFTLSEAFNRLDPVDQELLVAQAEVMGQYSTILEARINQFALHDTV